MTPLQFEQMYQGGWTELENQLNDILRGRSIRKGAKQAPIDGEQLAELYRRACEHLALARARAYPTYIQDRLDRLTAEAHQVIYQHRGSTGCRGSSVLRVRLPAGGARAGGLCLDATALFVLPTIIIGFLVYSRPELILSVVDADTAASYEQMYSPDADSIGRTRTADTDWSMFGFYIRNNITVAFQCFAGGLFAGLGSLFFLAYNGLLAGAVAGYLTERGMRPRSTRSS